MHFWLVLIFWALMIVWLVLGIKGWWPLANTTKNTNTANIILWLIFFLIGLQIFKLPFL